MTESGQYDDATLARQKIAAALLGSTLKPEENVRHWAQGLANMAKAGIGGYMGYQADQARRDQEAGDTAALAKQFPSLGITPKPVADSPSIFQSIGSLLGSGGAPTAPAAAAAAPVAGPAQPVAPVVAPSPATALTPESPDYSKAIAGIESGGAYDKLGPQTGGDRAYGKYQVMGKNIPEWTAQTLGKPMSPQEFLANPDAQEAVFKARFGDYVQKYGPEGAAKAWFAGEKGMNNPAAKDVLGTTVDGYGKKFTQAIGGPEAISAALTATAAPRSVAPAAVATPVAATGDALSGLSQEQRAQIKAGLEARPGSVARGIAMQLIGNATKGDAPTDNVKEFNAENALRAKLGKPALTSLTEFILEKGGKDNEVKPMSPEQRKAYGVPEGMAAQIDSHGRATYPTGTNINLNTAQSGTKAMQEKAIEDYQTAQSTSRDAVKRSQVWDQMEQATKGFTPGATADMKLTAKRFLKDTGVIAGEDVPDAEVFKQMQQQIAIHAQPKGQGAVSNVERELFAKAIPNITMSPEGLSKSIKISRDLDSFDRKVAQVYRDNAKKNGGIPNSVEVNEEIEKLGSPLTVGDTNYLNKAAKAEGAAAPAATAPAAVSPAAGGDPGAIEELKKRKKWPQ